MAQLTRNHKPSIVLDPTLFKETVALRNQLFSGTEQFDVMEFIQYLFEFINEETSMELKEEKKEEDQLAISS